MKKVLVFGVCTLLLFTGCSASSGNNKKDNNKKDISVKVNQNKDVSVDYVITTDQNAVFAIKNNTNDKLDYVSIDIAAYGKDGNLKLVEKQYIHNLDAGQESFVKSILNNGTVSNIEIGKLEVAANVTNYEKDIEESYSSKVSATIAPSDTDGQLTLNVTNTSGQVLDEINIAAVFYKEGKIVDLYTVVAQQIGETYTDVVYIPSTINEDQTMKYVEYDDVKLVVNNATKYVTY